jgi:hypothetical protein
MEVSTTATTFGRSGSPSDAAFDGKMDEVAVWNSALTASQILAIYNKGQPANLGIYNPTSWWRMGEGDDAGGTIISDLAFRTGPDLITNGDFATDSDWVKGDGWTISGGVASNDGSGAPSDMYQDAGLDSQNTIYEVTFTVSNYSSGSVRTVVGGAGAGTWRNANGIYIEHVAVASGPNFYMQSSSFVGSIDNVVVKKINGNPATLVNEPTWSTDSP